MPKNFAEEPFCAVFQKSSGSEKIYGQEGGECQNFPSKFFCLKVPKNFAGEPSSLSLVSGIEKNHASEGYVTILRLKFFVSQCRKISQRNLFVLCFRNLLVAKKFMDKKGGECQSFLSKFFCLKVPKNFIGEPSSLSLISGIEKVWMRGWGVVSRFSV